MEKFSYIWTRVSTKHQEDNGGSLDDQKCHCEKFAKDNGYTIKGYFGGKHESAKTPGKLIKEMIAAIKKDKSVKYFTSSNPDRNFAFRIRTKKDKNGKIVSAYYGKIYGDIEIKKPYTVEVSVAAPSFMYYLNPKPLDRNLEWDMKTNLCPNPGSISKEP